MVSTVLSYCLIHAYSKIYFVVVLLRFSLTIFMITRAFLISNLERKYILKYLVRKSLNIETNVNCFTFNSSINYRSNALTYLIYIAVNTMYYMYVFIYHVYLNLNHLHYIIIFNFKNDLQLLVTFIFKHILCLLKQL